MSIFIHLFRKYLNIIKFQRRGFVTNNFKKLFFLNIRGSLNKFPDFFVWALLLIVHTWNSSPLRSILLRLQCTCSSVPTTSGRLHGSLLVWACQWPSSQPLSSPQLSHIDSLWAKGITKSHREQRMAYREGEDLSWCPSLSNSLWQGWSCGLVHCPGGNATDPIWRVQASSLGISSWTHLQPQHSNPNPNPLVINSGVLTSLLFPHLSSSLTDSMSSFYLLCHSKTDARFMQDCPKAVWSIPYVSAAVFPSLKQNLFAYRYSKVSSCPDCIF